IASGIDLTDEQLDQIVEQLKASGLGDLVTLEQANGLITGIQLVEVPGFLSPNASAEFTTAFGLVDYTFIVEDKDNPVIFKKGLVLSETTERHVLLQVTPANAAIEEIFLIDSKGISDVKKYVEVKAKPYSGLITKADGASALGLWEITLKLTNEYTTDAKSTFESLAAILKSDGTRDKNVAFALAVSTGEGRLVLTKFDYVISVSLRNPVYSEATITANDKEPLQFEVKDISVNGATAVPVDKLANRLTISNGIEYVWADKTPANNIDPKKNTKNAPNYDARSTQSILAVTYDKPFEVTTEVGFAYYIGLDLDNATATEKTAWTKEGAIAGLNKVYRAGEKAQITIKDEALKNKAVGFRIIAVNYDGTLVDPDGRAFYVSAGAISSPVELGTLTFSPKIEAKVASATTALYSNSAKLDWTKLGESGITVDKVYGYKFTLDSAVKDYAYIVGNKTTTDTGGNAALEYGATSWYRRAGGRSGNTITSI
ncbi:hypothetical protein EZS27_034878, partial [termite gut metagenome]